MDTKKLLTVILAVLFIIQLFIACGNGKEEETTRVYGIEEENEVSDPNARINRKDNLPADLNFGGQEIRILLPPYASMDFPAEATGDIVTDAVYDKNIRVQERLNVKFTYGSLPFDGQNETSIFNGLHNIFLAGDDVYDLLCIPLYYCTYIALTTIYYMDLQDMPYLDFEQPWWNKTSIMELSHDNESIKYLIGEVSLTTIAYAASVFYNKNMYNDVYGDPDALYGVALDGKWTLDYFGEKCRGLYLDINGDGVADPDDQYGSTFEWWTFRNVICGSSDARMTGRDTNGFVYLDMDMNRLLTFCEKMYDLCYNNLGVDYYSKDAPALNPVFMNRQMAFYPVYLNGALAFRALEDDYGILPMPKLDEQQKEYRSLININTSVVCVPGTCKIAETVCAVIEALAAESYRTVTEVYYEVALKTKYSRDEYSGQVIDIVNSAAYIDFLFTYLNHLNQSAQIVYYVVDGSKSTDLMSYYAKNETSYKSALEKLINNLSNGVA
ncbi:MAG: hypothetical protein FWF15_03110 [Oscillospiraceae bacterium]|nr:hypothetical protein [Oscillospiraceae bacterium]